MSRGGARVLAVARLRHDLDIVERFPAIVGGVIHATGVHNGPTPARLAAAFDEETLAVRARPSTMFSRALADLEALLVTHASPDTLRSAVLSATYTAFA